METRCTYDADSLGKTVGKERKQSTAIQWVSAQHAVPAEVRLYDKLLTIADADNVEEGKSFLDYLNGRSLEVLTGGLVEPGLAQTPAGERFQFVRHGYFIADAEDSQPARWSSTASSNCPTALPRRWRSRPMPKAAQPGRRPRARRQPPLRSARAPTPPAATGSLSDKRQERARSANTLLAQRHDYYLDVLGLTPQLADVLTGDEAVAHFYDAALAVHNNPKAIASGLPIGCSRVEGQAAGTTAVHRRAVGRVGQAAGSGGAHQHRGRRASLRPCSPPSADASPAAIVRRLGLEPALSAAELAAAVNQVLAALPDKVAEYRNGKASLLGMFTGQVIKATGGKASPQAVQAILKDRLA